MPAIRPADISAMKRTMLITLTLVASPAAIATSIKVYVVIRRTTASRKSRRFFSSSARRRTSAKIFCIRGSLLSYSRYYFEDSRINAVRRILRTSSGIKLRSRAFASYSSTFNTILIVDLTVFIIISTLSLSSRA